MDARLVVLAARLRLDVAQGRFGKGSSTTTFAVPFRSQNFGLKGGCLFGGELRVVALSAAAYALARDGAADRERTAGFASGDGEWHLRTSSRARSERASKGINLPERNTGI